MKDYLIKMEQTKRYILEKVNDIPKVAIILGSGLGSLADDITDKIVLPYQDIPNFPISTVAGHKGELIFGTIENIPVIAMNGRFHYYEGYSLLETKGDGIANYLGNTDLKYAIVNYTKAKTNKMFILDFKDGVNSTIKEKKEYKMSSGGLSTGGIVAVAVPTCAVLLGVAGLSFFLSRNNSTPPPQIKTMSNMNMQNNTMGVIANSSEAVIHQ